MTDCIMIFKPQNGDVGPLIFSTKRELYIIRLALKNLTKVWLSLRVERVGEDAVTNLMLSTKMLSHCSAPSRFLEIDHLRCQLLFRFQFLLQLQLHLLVVSAILDRLRKSIVRFTMMPNRCSRIYLLKQDKKNLVDPDQRTSTKTESHSSNHTNPRSPHTGRQRLSRSSCTSLPRRPLAKLPGTGCRPVFTPT